jgi:hypothetical protein
MGATREFRLKKAGDDRVIVWPVEVPVPVDGGQVEMQTLRVRFQLMLPEKLDELLKSEVAEAAGKGKAGADGLPLLRVVVKGFVDFREADDAEPMPDADAIPLLLGTPYVALALQAAYFDMMAGRARKN